MNIKFMWNEWTGGGVWARLGSSSAPLERITWRCLLPEVSSPNQDVYVADAERDSRLCASQLNTSESRDWKAKNIYWCWGRAR